MSLPGAPATPQSKAKSVVADLLQSYSSIVFIGSPVTGVLILLCTFAFPNIAACGLITLLMAYGLLRALGRHVLVLRDRAVLYNSLLVGLYAGYLFQLDTTLCLLLGAAAGLTLLLTLFFEAFLQVQGLPILSLPFALVAALLSTASGRFSNVMDATSYFHEFESPLLQLLPEPLQIFFRSMGCILCIPDPIFGMLLWLVILSRSPLIATALAVGFSLGFGVESYVQLPAADPSASHYFNYSLIFTAIATVLLIPSPVAIFLAAVGVVVASLVVLGIEALAAPYHIAMTALPFNLMVLFLLRAVYSLQPLRAATVYAGDPEETIERSRLYLLRHRGGEPGVFCPFDGAWQVQQSFDGRWTHQGNWRHALDFVVVGEGGKTYRDRGFEPSDYYAFGQPILAPVEGYVTAVCSNLDDNPIARVENQQNWGNYVIIRSLFGYHVVLAHLKKDSVCVHAGDYVKVRQKLGECGNSGYSQEPHLHMQVQYSPVIGAYTAPFHLINYLEGDRFNFHEVPKEGAVVEPISFNLAVDRALTFRLGDSFHFQCQEHGESREVIVKVGFDELRGALYLSEGSSRLYFGRVGAQFYFYGFEGKRGSVLAHFMMAAPRLPMTYKKEAMFTDHLPLRITDSWLSRWFRLWRGNVSRRYWLETATYRFDPVALELKGSTPHRGKRTETYARFDPLYGLQEIRVGEVSYVRKVAVAVS